MADPELRCAWLLVVEGVRQGLGGDGGGRDDVGPPVGRLIFSGVAVDLWRFAPPRMRPTS